MDFITAMKAVKEGKKIRRELWDRKINVAMNVGFLSIIDEKDGLYHPWQISESDVYAQDWEVKEKEFDA